MAKDAVKALAYTPRGACVATGHGLTKVYELIGAGVLEAKKSGRSTLITAVSIEKYLASLPRAKITTRAKAFA